MSKERWTRKNTQVSGRHGFIYFRQCHSITVCSQVLELATSGLETQLLQESAGAHNFDSVFEGVYGEECLPNVLAVYFTKHECKFHLSAI
jgi:hypothetical protein